MFSRIVNDILSRLQIEVKDKEAEQEKNKEFTKIIPVLVLGGIVYILLRK